jgi:DNA-binding NarL/FixJ family response regulator
LRLAEPYLALCEAEATRLDGRSDPEAWATAAKHFLDLGQPYTCAYARYREGEAVLAMRHDAARARSVLRDAHSVAVGLGAAPLRAAIEEVARRGRVDLSEGLVPRGRSTGPGGLTAREQEILALVADGLSNRQIGERLFITEKTASHHVSNILGKLGVAGRVEAAAEAVRLGITTRPT